MQTLTSTAEYLRQVVHLFLAVVDTDLGKREPHERALAIELSQQWAPQCDRVTIEAVVDTAYVATRSGCDIDAIARELRESLSVADRNRLLADLGRIAQADGHLTLREASVIRRIRAAFGSAQNSPPPQAPDSPPLTDGT